MLAAIPQADGAQRFIVRYRDGSSQRNSVTLALDSANTSLRQTRLPGTALAGGAPTLQLRHLRRLGQGADVLASSRRLTTVETNALLSQLRSDPAVAYAQVDRAKYAMASVPNDPNFNLQWDYTDSTGGIDAPKAWSASTGEGVVVAVLDTGYRDHADLVNNIVPGYDFISYYGQTVGGDKYPDIAGDGDGRDADALDPGDWIDEGMTAWCSGAPSASSWHGTHVAGTVAAVANNGKYIAGVAYNAKVQPVRVLGHCGGTTSDIADAITWASGGTVSGIPANPTPAEVLNLSLGGYGACSDDPATQEAIDGAIRRGVTVVVAAGNQNDNVANFTPASCKGVIAVGATGVDGGKSWFSNYGLGVTVSAPGGNAKSGSDPDNRWIWSLGNSGQKQPESDNLLGMIGTSQAAPHVAAVAALMQSAAVAAGLQPLTPAQIRRILQSTARPFPLKPPASTPMGPGIIDAAAAVAAASMPAPAEEAVVLTSRQAIVKPLQQEGDSTLYSISVPDGVGSLNLRTFGGTGNVSLYVSRDEIPNAGASERSSTKPGNVEAVVYTRPLAGTYYMRVVAEQTSQNVSVMATY
jgi:serine protease